LLFIEILLFEEEILLPIEIKLFEEKFQRLNLTNGINCDINELQNTIDINLFLLFFYSIVK
jgi:hypothetical protein